MRRLLDALLGAATLWSRRAPVDDAVVVSVMEMLVVERHRGYLEHIPVYRRLAEDQDVTGDADLHTIVDGMMFSTEVFKSYAPGWLHDGQFAAMTEWVSEVSSLRPRAPCADVRDVEGWREDLQRQGVRLSSSSGTSGHPSFVPRDRPTWAALCGNGRYYADDDGLDATGFDLLAMMPSGHALGLQAAATGLARRAADAHFLDGALAEALPAAIVFLEAAAERGRPVLVFGTPHHAEALCNAVLATERPLALASGSRMITGGGWKGERSMAREALHELVCRAMHLNGEAIVDAYSATELNCVLSTCSEGHYHVPPLIQPILLDDALEWIDDGEGTGMLGFFDPFAGSYPGFLITGDQGHLSRAPCPCGRTGWSIRGPITRAPGHEPRGCAGTLAAGVP